MGVAIRERVAGVMTKAVRLIVGDIVRLTVAGVIRTAFIDRLGITESEIVAGVAP